MRIRGLSAAAILLAVVASPAPAAEVLDQQNDVNQSATADTAFPFSQEVGQTFTVGVAGTLNRIENQLVRITGSGGNAILTVYNTLSGVPNASLGTATLSTSAIPSTGFAYLSFDVSSSAIPVSVGQVLAFGIKSSGEAGYGLRSTFNLNTYSGGESKWRALGTPPGPWNSFSPSHDSGFRTYVLASAAGLPGDFNNNSKVDAADYVVWRQHKGEPSETPLNGNGDGLNGVDQGDYTLWRSHFAPTSGSAAGLGAAIPEPSSLKLLLITGLGIGCGRRKSK